MTQDDIIRMAREAGAYIYGFKKVEDITFSPESLERFAQLVAAAEREACAKVCESRLGPTATYFYGKIYAEAIRARGNT